MTDPAREAPPPGGRGRRRKVLGLLAVTLLLLVSIQSTGVARGMWSTLQRKMIFFPTAEIMLDPGDVGLAYEDVPLQTADGVKLHGWYVPAEGAKVTLLFLHGNAGNIGDRVENVKLLHGLGLSVFILDYRGYGRSAGSPSEQGLYRDAEAAFAYLGSRSDVDAGRIAIFGRSLGGAVAVDLARRVSCWRLILESTFTSTADMAREVFPILPVGPLLTERFDSLSKVKGIHAPLLQFHGTRDEVVPFALGQRLFEAAPEPKTFVPIEGAGHNDTYLVGGAPYFQRIGSFLAVPP